MTNIRGQRRADEHRDVSARRRLIVPLERALGSGLLRGSHELLDALMLAATPDNPTLLTGTLRSIVRRAVATVARFR